MTKTAEASGFYDDGIAYLFKDSDGMPETDLSFTHVHLEIQTGS